MVWLEVNRLLSQQCTCTISLVCGSVMWYICCYNCCCYPTQPKVALLKPKEPQGRKRRQTEFKPPNLNELLQPPMSYEAPEKGGGMPMRRSLSDADNTQEIAHMLATKRKALGNLSLYFGCRRHNLDFIYKDEIKKMQVSGILTDVNVAFSREPGKSKVNEQCSPQYNYAKTCIRNINRKNTSGLMCHFLDCLFSVVCPAPAETECRQDSQTAHGGQRTLLCVW